MAKRTLLISTVLMTSILALSACSDADNTPAKTASAAQSSPPKLQESADLSPLAGFASARFGSDEAAVRAAWKGSLRDAGGTSDSCRQLVQDPAPAKGFGTSFMLENGTFVRYDIDSRERKAPRGLQVGSSAQQIRATFPSHFEEQPSKYVKGGRDFIVKPYVDTEARLIFETDSDGIVTRWRIGMPPAVFYVEGCN